MAVKITNATAIYTIMMLVFAAGMWAVLMLGGTLRPAHDLAGEWELSPEGSGEQKPLRATIEQSGRFVRMKIDGGNALDLRMEPEPKIPSASPAWSGIELTGADAKASFGKTIVPDLYRLTLQMPDQTHRRFTARIVNRTYPRPVAANKLPVDWQPREKFSSTRAIP